MGKKEYALKSKERDPSYKRMHGNYPAKKYKKGTPVVTRLSYELDGNDTAKFIDIAKDLSAINRRMYRQGCYYYVQSVEYYNNENKFLDVFSLPDSWTTKSAYRRGLGIWNEMNEKTIVGKGGVLPKYHDFKIWMSDVHRQTGNLVSNTYGPENGANPTHDPQTVSPSDWVHSKFYSADDDASSTADGFQIHMVGPTTGSPGNYTSVGLIKSYAKTRPMSQSSEPRIASDLEDDPLVMLHDASEEEQHKAIMQTFDTDNDSQPYNNGTHVGELEDSLVFQGRLLTTDVAGRKDMIGGFCAPVGLLMLIQENGTGTTSRLVVNLAVGTYNGVYAERIA